MADRHITVRPSQVTAAKLLVKIAEREGRSVAPEIQMIADAGGARSATTGALNGSSSAGRTASGARLTARTAATRTSGHAG